jgi:hypothetical protein
MPCGRRSAHSMLNEPHPLLSPPNPTPTATPRQGIDAGRKQYAEILADLKFVSNDYATTAAVLRGQGGGGRGQRRGEGVPSREVDEHSGNARVVKAALAAGFYPQVRCLGLLLLCLLLSLLLLFSSFFPARFVFLFFLGRGRGTGEGAFEGVCVSCVKGGRVRDVLA